MWTRKLLKTNAKQALKGRYWGAFLVCLILGILGVTNTATVSGASSSAAKDAAAGDSAVSIERFVSGDVDADTLLLIAGISLGILLLIVAVALCWKIFVVNPLTVGRNRYFIQNRSAAPGAAAVTSVFRDGYMSVVKAQLLTNLKICVGFILFMIPGIYWSYCYALVPYLLADDPHLGAGEAMAKSKQLMDGQKWRFFVLCLSFIGWDILCAFTFGIGGLFLEPYKQATYAEFYAAVSSKTAAEAE